MSAREVIRLIDALPQQELDEVLEFCQTKMFAAKTQAEESSINEEPVRYASLEQVKDVANRVFSVNDALFRKLAQ